MLKIEAATRLKANEDEQISPEALNEIFKGFNWQGFKPITFTGKEYNDTQNPKLKAMMAVNLSDEDIKLRVWSRLVDPMVEYITVIGRDIKEVRTELQAAFDKMMERINAGHASVKANMAIIKKNNRKPTKKEIELLSTMIAASNMGGSCEYTIEGDKINFKETYARPVDLHKLDHVISAADDLHNAFYSEGHEDAVAKEIKSWAKKFSGESLLDLSVHTELVPLLAWLAVKGVAK